MNRSGFDVVRIDKDMAALSARKTGIIGGFTLDIPPGHPILLNLKRYPRYGMNVPRLARVLHEKYGNMIAIDIGANIGDTVALIKSGADIPIIAIEGDAGYFAYLKKNTDLFKDIDCLQLFLGEKGSLISAKIERADGTLRLMDHSQAPNAEAPAKKEEKEVSVTTLDALLSKDSRVDNMKLLKIDTDGYDLKIIKGGMEYLKRAKPTIFFEYDPTFFTETGCDGLSTFKDLSSLGYKQAAFYDNYGRFIISADIADRKLMVQLTSYVKDRQGGFAFYDICVFHADDNDLADRLAAEEAKINDHEDTR